MPHFFSLSISSPSSPVRCLFYINICSHFRGKKFDILWEISYLIFIYNILMQKIRFEKNNYRIHRRVFFMSVLFCHLKSLKCVQSITLNQSLSVPPSEYNMILTYFQCGDSTASMSVSLLPSEY